MTLRTPSTPTINHSRNVLRGPRIAFQRVDSGVAAAERAGVGSPAHETTISEPAGDAAKASRSLSAPHRELLAALLRLDEGALAVIGERPLSPPPRPR
jgi:hypothetical protein